jgi:hypothetical protein
MWGRFGVLPSTLDCATGTLTLGADPASWLEFDALGSLLAVGTINGVLRIYDFDEYVTSRSSCRPEAASGTSSRSVTNPVVEMGPSLRNAWPYT